MKLQLALVPTALLFSVVLAAPRPSSKGVGAPVFNGFERGQEGGSFASGGRRPRRKARSPVSAMDTKLPPGSVVIATGEGEGSDLESRIRLVLRMNGLVVSDEIEEDQSSSSFSPHKYPSNHMVKYTFNGASKTDKDGIWCHVDVRGAAPVLCRIEELGKKIREFPEDKMVNVVIKTPTVETSQIVVDTPPMAQYAHLTGKKDVVVLAIDAHVSGKSIPKNAILGSRGMEDAEFEALMRKVTKKVVQCRANFASRQLPGITGEIKVVERKLRETREEIQGLNPEKLIEAGGVLREKFCKNLDAALQGSISAPPSRFGETLAMERSRCIPMDGDKFPSLPEEWTSEIGNVNHQLFGGAQYHRALREMALIVSLCPTSAVSDEEVALAGGVGEVHDGPNFLRAACLIAMEKAYGSFEPLLESFAGRCEYIMKNTFDAVDYMVMKENGAESGRRAGGGELAYQKPFRNVVRRIYEEFVEKKAREAVGYCKDDLVALTKYITWDLEERGTAGLAEAVGGGGEEAVGVWSVAIKRTLSGEAAGAAGAGVGGGLGGAERKQKKKKGGGKGKRKAKGDEGGGADVLAQWAQANGGDILDLDAGEETGATVDAKVNVEEESGNLVGGLMDRGGGGRSSSRTSGRRERRERRTTEC